MMQWSIKAKRGYEIKYFMFHFVGGNARSEVAKVAKHKTHTGPMSKFWQPTLHYFIAKYYYLATSS